MNEKLKHDKIYTTNEQLQVKTLLAHLFEKNQCSTEEKLGAFAKYITRQDLSLFLARYEIFKLAQPIKGSIVECGVYYGNGLMTYAQLSAALEPINYNRRIIGFDTFEGNASQTQMDSPSKSADSLSQVEYAIDSEKELLECIEIHDQNRFLNHIPKVELIRGDMTVTVPEYIRDNPHCLISILELTVNLYEPTKIALEYFTKRMSKGSIIALNTLNEGVFPGVTLAILEELDIRDYEIKTFEYAPNLSYIVL